MHPYVALWLWAMKGLLKLAAPIYLIGTVVLVVYGAFSRLPEHDALLELTGYEIPVLIGIGEKQRSYVVIPRVFYRPSINSVVEVAPSQFERIETFGGFILYLIMLIGAALGSWRFWILPRRVRNGAVSGA